MKKNSALEHKYQGEKGVYIAELAGKDSIAAMKVIIDCFSPKIIVPVAIDIGVERGGDEAPAQNVKLLRDLLLKEKKAHKTTKAVDVVITEIVEIDFSRLYNRLVLQTMGEFQQCFPFFSPCPPCHFFLHYCRVPIAQFLGVNAIITGERELHDDRVKINQTSDLLSFFVDYFEREENLKLMQPLRKINRSKEIHDVLNKSWNLEGIQKSCIFSGNYRDTKGKVFGASEDWVGALKDFYAPKMKREFHKLLKN